MPNAHQITAGTKLRHYKGGLYKPLQGDKQDLIWMQPMSELQDMVTTVDGSVPRFVLISEGA
jgi:hypothetical protein